MRRAASSISWAAMSAVSSRTAIVRQLLASMRKRTPRLAFVTLFTCAMLSRIHTIGNSLSTSHFVALRSFTMISAIAPISIHP
jgi:hypothetical protein